MIGRRHPNDSHSSNAVDSTRPLWDQPPPPTTAHPVAKWLPECKPAWTFNQDREPTTEEPLAPTPAESAACLDRWAAGIEPLLKLPHSLLDSPIFSLHSPELKSAFLEDITRCIIRLQPALLHLQGNPQHQQSLNQVRCDLHTLKGVSATVGLQDWADYLHQLEEQLHSSAANEELPIEPLLIWIKQIHTDLVVLRQPSQSFIKSHLDRPPLPAIHSADAETCSTADEFARLAGANAIHSAQSTATLASRRIVSSDPPDCSQYHPTDQQDPQQRTGHSLSCSGMQPARLLFQRLQQAVDDVARTEQKIVQWKLSGADVPIEPSLEKRLFEPLMHLVRNSVCHGIEIPEKRLAAGKPAEGTIQIALVSTPEWLMIEVADDGSGLDYQAIRQRGIQLGLLHPASDSDTETLKTLIFHPNFSTCCRISQGAGRGMGMYIALTAVQELCGRLEVETLEQQGTRFRLFIPSAPCVKQPR